jgi:putative peptidoglycan lipid II flippase
LLIVAGLVAGFGREILFAYYYGTSSDVEVIRVAIGLPSILSDSLAVSFVSILIPVLLAGEQSGDTDAHNRIVWSVLIVGVVAFLIGWSTMGLQSRYLAPGITGPDQVSLIWAGRLCWIMFLAVLLSLAMRASLSVNNRIWPGAGAQFIRSAGFVVALIILVSLSGAATVETAAIAAVAGGLSVFVVHVAALGRSRRRIFVAALWSAPQPRYILPIIAALALVFLSQIMGSAGRIIDRALASEMAAGTLAALEYSYALTMAVAAVTGTSSNLFLAPRIGRAFRASGRLPRDIVREIIVATALAGVAGVFCATFSDSIVRTIFQYGKFTADDVAITAAIFQLHALSLGPLVLALILTQVLLLGGLQTIVVSVSAIKLVVKIGVVTVFLSAGWGVAALAISLGITELVTAGILVFAVHYKGLFRPNA